MPEKIPNIAPLSFQYPIIEIEDIPREHTLCPIDYRKDEVDSFDVLFFHRLLRKNYGDPSEFVYDVSKLGSIFPENSDYHFALREGNPRLISDAPLTFDQEELSTALRKGEWREWKYYVRTKHGDVILIQTERCHSEVSIHHVLRKNTKEPNQKTVDEGKKFIDSLLREADRQLKGGQLYNLKADFEKEEGVSLYLLHNVFLENYLTAVFLLQASVEGEEHLREKIIEFDASDSLVQASKEKMKHIEHFQSIKGAYYSSSIMYFFMAFEGFINLLYHAFLRDEYRSQNEDINRRFDLEQKLLFLPALCYGFRDELVIDSDFLENFKKLKNFRNSLIHAKISDALYSGAFVEQGFVYSRKVTKKKGDAFPAHKLELNVQDAIDFSKRIESMLNHIKGKMDDEHRELVQGCFMESQFIGFRRDGNKLRLVKGKESNDSSEV